MRSRIINYPNIASTLALVFALSGGAYAAGLVGTHDIKNGAVTTLKIHKRAVDSGRLKSKSVGTGKIKDSAVGSTQLADGSVGLADISTEVTDALGAAISSVAPKMVNVSNSGIQQVGPTSGIFASMTVPDPGNYLVVGSLRVFSRPGNPGHNLFCNFGNGPNLVNNWVNSSTEVLSIPLSGPLQTFSPNEVVNLSCRQGSGSGEITLTYDISAVKVVG
jgi:hypothetical protein